MAACGGMGNYGQPDGGDCDDCVKVVKTTKKVQVPCHRNEYKQYTVKVPREVVDHVPRKVQYTDYEMRCKQVPYQATEKVTKYRDEQKAYQVPVAKQVTKMVPVTKKVPKTIYVDMTVQVPKKVCTTVMETKYRTVKIPYTVDKCVTKYKSVPTKVPVCKTKTVMETVKKTVYDDVTKTRCVPKMTYVTKTIPVWNVIAKPAQPCPPQQPEPQPCPPPEPEPEPCAPCGTMDPQPGNPGNPGGPNIIDHALEAEFMSIDKNKDMKISYDEYAAARQPPM